MKWTFLAISLVGLIAGAAALGTGIGLYMLIAPLLTAGWVLMLVGGFVLALSALALWQATRQL